MEAGSHRRSGLNKFEGAVEVDQQRPRYVLRNTYDFIVCVSRPSESVVAPAGPNSSHEWAFVAKANPGLDDEPLL